MATKRPIRLAYEVAAQAWDHCAVSARCGRWLAFFGLSNAITLRRLARDGVATEARVIAHAHGQYSRRSSSYRLTIEFTPSGRAALTKTLDVDGNDYRPAVESGRVQVRYLPNDPETCTAGDMAVLPFQIVGAFGSGVFVLGLFTAWFGRRAAS